MTESGKPVLFIKIDEVVDNDNIKHQQFNMTQEAMQLLSSIQDRNIAVLVIAGPYRTGKSFLANRFLKQMDGFEIGPSTNPCTKGIWIWNKPVKLNETTDLIILDTEGLNSIQRDQTIDMKIFSISVLLASMFVYNNLGHIDEQAIESLSLVARLSENICIQKVNENQQKLGEYFPHFFWVLRDFSLDLKGMTPNEYLENCLRPLSESSQEAIKKNIILDKFRQFFRVRDCETLVRPLEDESKLARIDKQDWNTLRPAFIEGVNNFEKKVLMNIKPKTIQNKVLNGKMFMGLVIEYLQAINSGGVPTILNSLESVISSQIRKVYEEARGEYMKQVNQEFSVDKLPLDDEKFQETHNKIINNIFQQLQTKSKNFVDADQLITLRNDLQQIMESEFKIRKATNQEIAQSKCKQIFLDLFQKLQHSNYNNSDQIIRKFVAEKFDDMQQILSQYNSQTSGSFKYQLFFNQFPQKIFEYFDIAFQRFYDLFNADIIKVKVQLQETNETKELIKNQVQLQDKTILDLQRDVNEAQKQIHNLKRENNKLKKSQENSDKSQFGKIEELEMSIQKKKTKIQKLNEKCQELEEQNHQFKLALSQKKIENQGLRKEIEELKRMGSSQGSGIEQDDIPDLINSIRDLKTQVQYMDDFFSSRRSSLNLSIGSQEQQFQDFEQIRKQQETLKKKNKQKLEQQKQIYENEKQELQRKIEVQVKYIDEIRAKNMELINQNQELKTKSIQANNLIQENERLREQLAAKQFNLETNTQVLNEFSKQIEKKAGIIIELENQLAYIKSYNCQLISFKETFPYILRESLKYALNRNSMIKHSLSKLNDEDINQVKDCFTKAGIEFKF
ncbi:hypothetical protein ABPG72_008120 [Tetrahymena utriculariae]